MNEEIEWVPILKMNVINLNDRMYTEKSVEQINDAFTKSKNNIGGFVGKIDHPDTTIDIELNDFRHTRVENITHVIRDIKVDNETLFGKLEILNTPQGNKLKDILPNVVFRPRLTGTVLPDKSVDVDVVYAIDAINKETDSFKGLI